VAGGVTSDERTTDAVEAGISFYATVFVLAGIPSSPAIHSTHIAGIAEP